MTSGDDAQAGHIVRAGYDRIADRYEAWAETVRGSPRRAWVDDLVGRLGKGADVLELGCGGGLRDTRELAARASLTGVDISAEQVRRARDRVPGARFLQADVVRLELPASSFDAVVALHVLNHIPRGELPGLVERVARWLRRDGLFLGTFGVSGEEGVQDDWLGVPMFFASLTREETVALLERAGFELERAEVVTQDEGAEGLATFLWVLGRLRR